MFDENGVVCHITDSQPVESSGHHKSALLEQVRPAIRVRHFYHEKDLADGFGEGALPYALARKYLGGAAWPCAARSLRH